MKIKDKAIALLNTQISEPNINPKKLFLFLYGLGFIFLVIGIVLGFLHGDPVYFSGENVAQIPENILTYDPLFYIGKESNWDLGLYFGLGSLSVIFLTTIVLFLYLGGRAEKSVAWMEVIGQFFRTFFDN